MPVPGLTHRYPDRCLMVVTNFCSMLCRHCTRKRIWTLGEAAKTEFELSKMFAYIRRHEEIRDVIVSGGDPLTLPTDRIEYILKSLRKIPHVEIIRIGTRVPVVLPMRIDDELCAVLGKYGPIWLNTQFNHPGGHHRGASGVRPAPSRGRAREQPDRAAQGRQRPRRDHPQAQHGAAEGEGPPYYLFQCDMVRGLDHFRTRLSKGSRSWRRCGPHLGLAIPSYVVDVPGAAARSADAELHPLDGRGPDGSAELRGIIVSYEEARDDGHPSARVDSALPPPRNDVYRLLTGEVRTLIPAGRADARRKRRCESGSPLNVKPAATPIICPRTPSRSTTPRRRSPT